MGRTHAEEVHGGLCPVGGNPWWNGMSEKILPLRKKEQKRQCVTKLLQLLFPFPLHGRRRNDDLSLSLSRHTSLLLYFPSPIQMRRAVSGRVSGVGTCCPVKVKPPYNKILSFVHLNKFILFSFTTKSS